jgi:hypothetical protein
MLRAVTRFAGFGAALVVAAIAAGAVSFILTDETSAPDTNILTVTPFAQTPEPEPTPLPRTWLDGLRRVYGDPQPQLLACADDGDAALTGADLPELDGQRIALEAGACRDPQQHADFYAGAFSSQPACGRPPAPLLLIAVASGGSDLLLAREGESLGLLDIINALDDRLSEGAVPHALVLAAPGIFGAAASPQTSMERWIEAYAGARLRELPCLRAVIVGHSHGGVTVTSVTAALEGVYADRMLGVAIDRTTKLYDRNATEMPRRARLLNVFQTNEGWHGEPIDAANVENVDESDERAPVAPSDGGGAPALVSHKTLDDAPAVQSRVVDEIVAWLGG